eukprot:585711-Amphidinium_carterae.1
MNPKPVAALVLKQEEHCLSRCTTQGITSRAQGSARQDRRNGCQSAGSGKARKGGGRRVHFRNL